MGAWGSRAALTVRPRDEMLLCMPHHSCTVPHKKAFVPAPCTPSPPNTRALAMGVLLEALDADSIRRLCCKRQGPENNRNRNSNGTVWTEADPDTHTHTHTHTYTHTAKRG